MKLKFITSLIVFVTVQLSTYSQNLILNQEHKRLGNYKTSLDTIIDRNSLEKLVKSLDTNLNYFEIPEKVLFVNSELDSIAKKIEIQPITKLDLDNDNHIDLIIIYSILDIFYLYNDKELKCIILDNINGARGNQILRPIIKNHKLLFEHTKYYNYYIDQEFYSELKVNQVEFINGTFIESSNKSIKHKIESIEFSTSGCYGECPVFKLNILKNRNSTYNAIEYNDTKGNYECVIDQKSHSEIEQFLNYIDFANLENEYQVAHTDDQTGILKITYDNGKVKNIYDYGMAGTLGLSRLYKIFLKLRVNQKWKKL